MAFPNQAQVVIVGGGIIGCSLAYHLPKVGLGDVMLIERKTLGCGTTWHAAGLIGQLRATHNMTQLAKYTADLLNSLEHETGQATGFVQCGSLAVAPHAERFEELKRGAAMARQMGIEAELATPSECRELWPLLNVEDIVGGLFLPKDGRGSPLDITPRWRSVSPMRRRITTPATAPWQRVISSTLWRTARRPRRRSHCCARPTGSNIPCNR